MTFDVCVIGNSHVGAIKMGWDEISRDHPEWNLDFFAAPGVALADTFVEDGILSTNNPELQKALIFTGGTDRIDLTRYHSFLIVGGSLKISLPEITRDHLFFKTPRCKKQLVSKLFIKEILSHRFRRSVAFKLAERIRSEVSTPIYCMPHPYPDTRVVDHKKWDVFKIVKKAGYTKEWRAIFESACSEILSNLAEPIFQNDSTIVDDVFTDVQFSVGTKRWRPDIEEDRPDDENFHMNSLFGIQQLEKFFSVVKPKRRGVVPFFVQQYNRLFHESL